MATHQDVSNRIRHIGHTVDEEIADYQQRGHHYSLPQDADSAAADTRTEHTLRFPAAMANGFDVLELSILPKGALTANDTTYATVAIKWDDAAGGADTTIASVTTETSGSGGTGNWVAGTAISMTVNKANNRVAANGCLIIVVTKASTGVQLPKFDLMVSGKAV